MIPLARQERESNRLIVTFLKIKAENQKPQMWEVGFLQSTTIVGFRIDTCVSPHKYEQNPNVDSVWRLHEHVLHLRLLVPSSFPFQTTPYGHLCTWFTAPISTHVSSFLHSQSTCRSVTVSGHQSFINWLQITSRLLLVHRLS